MKRFWIFTIPIFAGYARPFLPIKGDIMNRFFLAGLMFLSPSAGVAFTRLSWECQYGSYWQGGAEITLILTQENTDEGLVFVAGTSHWAMYGVAGVDRRWDFDLDKDSSFKYALIMKPDGHTAYYDFTNSEDGKAKSRQYFICRPLPPKK